MEEIRCKLNNNPAFFWLMILMIGVLLFYSLFNNFVFLTHFTTDSFYLMVVVIVVLIVGWNVLKVRLTLSFYEEKPRVTAKGLFAKKVFTWPFEFNSGVSDSFSYSPTTRVVRHLIIKDEKKSISIDASTIIYSDSYKNSNIGPITFDSLTASGINKVLVMDIAKKIEPFKMKQDKENE